MLITETQPRDKTILGFSGRAQPNSSSPRIGRMSRGCQILAGAVTMIKVACWNGHLAKNG